MDSLTLIARTFGGLLVDAGPLFLLGLVASAAIQRWLRPEHAERWLAGGGRSVFLAALAGAVLPGCAVTTMPLAIGLRRKGVPIGTLMAFIMVAPVISPHTLVLNAFVLGLPMTVGRLVVPFLFAVPVGIALNRLLHTRPAAAAVLDAPKSGCGCGGACGARPAGLGHMVWTTARDILPYFLGGLAAVAILQVFVPADFFPRYIGRGWTGYLAAAAAGIPLYVCEGAEVPLTLALLKLGAGPGPAFTFLLCASGVCLPTLAMAPKVVGAPATAVYVAGWIVMAIGGGVLFQAIAC
jgi:hypothetical protein